ncbi:zinc finger, RING-type protein [Pseudohyphozyma bogoriensis]|nr:zinc finger, RING-type protein [Pseudohyphozyma bogoriensis]
MAAPLSPTTAAINVSVGKDPLAPASTFTTAPGGLPTPSSLPRGSAASDIHARAGSSSTPSGEIAPVAEAEEEEEYSEERMERSSSESAAGDASGADELETFLFDDVEMDTPLTLAYRRFARVGLGFGASSVFSSNVLIRRPHRSRYADDEVMPDAAPPLILAPSAPSVPGPLLGQPFAPPSKRSFEEVSPSSGSTPPASSSTLGSPSSLISTDVGTAFSPFASETSTAPLPLSHSHHRHHSFESQRAFANSSLRSRYLRSIESASNESGQRGMDPLVTFWREEREHSLNSERVHRESRAILDAAQERLDAAEATLRAPPADSEAPVARPTDIPAGSTSTDGWSARHRRRSTLGGGSAPIPRHDLSPPPSPPSGSEESPLGTSASRARHFLSNLRSRRPRLSRNSTGVSPPEESPVTSPDPANAADREFSWSLPLPDTAPLEWSEQEEIVEAERLNQRLLARRAVATWTDANEERGGANSLWGQVEEISAAPSPSGLQHRRMRGPTERANEQWRRGSAPSSSHTTTARSHPSEPIVVPPWRRTSLDDPPRRLWSDLPASRIPQRRDADGEVVPRTNRTDDEFRDRQRASFSRVTATEESRRLSAPRLRINPIPPPSRRATSTNARASRLDLLMSDDEPGSEADTPQWRPPNLPLMLPSGSAGRRIVFPHPAAAAGPSEEQPAPVEQPLEAEWDLPFADRTALREFRRRTTGMAEAAEEASSNARQNYRERLASLRRERAVMQALLPGEPLEAPPGPGAGPAAPAESPVTASPPRSPNRRRGLSDFLRGLSGTRLGTLFDDDFGAFWGRDAVALDPRNYLDDDDFDTSYESLLRLSERLGDVKPKGVPEAKLSELRRFPYSQWPLPTRRQSITPPVGVASTSAVTMDEDVVPFARRGLEKEERCAVCLMDYEDDDECMLGVCEHGFHAECLTAWLKEHAQCPHG